MRRFMLALIVVATMLVVLTKEARACSCNTLNPYEALARYDAAFVGELVSIPREGSPGELGIIEGDYVFLVEQAVKGDLPERITVRSPLHGESCGFEIGIGQRVGIFLRMVDGNWRGGLCSQIDPDALMAAAESLPAPESDGSIVALIGSITPEGRTIAVNGEGDTVAYGAGEGEVFGYAVCPESRTVIELVVLRNDRLTHRIGVRDLRGLHVVREIAGEDMPAVGNVRAIECLDPAGDEILLFEARDAGDRGHHQDDPRDRHNGRIVRVSGSKIEVVAELPEQSDCYGASAFAAAAFDVPNELAYFTGGPNCLTLYRYDMVSDAITELVTIQPAAEMDSIGSIALSTDGRYLALEALGPRINTFRQFVLDLQADPLTPVEAVYLDRLNESTSIWLDRDRLLLTGPVKRGQALIVDPRLETIVTLDGLPPGVGGIHGETLYVVARGGRLVSAPADGGAARELRIFLDPDIQAVAILPEGVRFDPSAARPDNLAVAATSPPASTDEPFVRSTARPDDLAVGATSPTVSSDESFATSTGARILGIGVLAMVVGAGIVLLGRSARRHHRTTGPDESLVQPPP